MTKIITLILALSIIVLDFIAYRKLKIKKVGRVFRKFFLCSILFSYLLILLTPLFMYVFINIENNQAMMKFSMFILTIYLILSLSRIIFYITWLPFKGKKTLTIGMFFTLFVFTYFIYSVFVTRTYYEVRKVEILFNNLPDDFNGYTLTFISDIHIGSMPYAAKEIEKVASIINGLNSDAVIFGGDLVNIHHSELSGSILCALNKIKGIDGTFMVFGNHDTGAYIKDSTKEFRALNKDSIRMSVESAGWTLLADSTVYIKRGNDSIALTGLDYSEKMLEFKHSLSAVN